MPSYGSINYIRYKGSGFNLLNYSVPPQIQYSNFYIIIYFNFLNASICALPCACMVFIIISRFIRIVKLFSVLEWCFFHFPLKQAVEIGDIMKPHCK